MNRHDASGLTWPHIRLSLFVQCKIPTDNRAAPVFEYSSEDSCPFTPIGLEIGAGYDGAAFGPLRMFIREGVVYACHSIDRTVIGMPCHAVHIPVHARLA